MLDEFRPTCTLQLLRHQLSAYLHSLGDSRPSKRKLGPVLSSNLFNNDDKGIPQQPLQYPPLTTIVLPVVSYEIETPHK